MRKKQVYRVNPRDEGPEDVGLHQPRLFSAPRGEFPYQPRQREELDVRENLGQSSLGIKTPQVPYRRHQNKKRHHDVSKSWTSDFPSFDDCQDAENSSKHSDQTRARAKTRDRDCVFPWNSERQEPKGRKRKLAEAGRLSCNRKAPRSSLRNKARRDPRSLEYRR